MQTNADDNGGKLFLSVNQLAERWSVHRATIWEWAKNGTIPKPVKLSPACTRFRLSDIEAHESKSQAA